MSKMSCHHASCLPPGSRTGSGNDFRRADDGERIMLGLLWLTLVPVAGVGGLGGGAGGGDLRETGGERDDDERRLDAGAGEVEERGGIA